MCEIQICEKPDNRCTHQKHIRYSWGHPPGGIRPILLRVKLIISGHVIACTFRQFWNIASGGRFEFKIVHKTVVKSTCALTYFYLQSYWHFSWIYIIYLIFE